MEKKKVLDNLERFRTEIKTLTKAEGPSKRKFEKSHGISPSQNLPKQSRKQRRKEDRLQKKERRNAYSRRLPVIIYFFAILTNNTCYNCTCLRTEAPFFPVLQILQIAFHFFKSKFLSSS